MRCRLRGPTDQHHDQVTAAARAGKHVLCEKPLGLEVAQAEAIEPIDTARAIEEIVQTEGLTGIVIEPNDLSFSMGLPGIPLTRTYSG